jgi:hypothetical protein
MLVITRLLKVLGYTLSITIAGVVTLIALFLVLASLMFGDIPGCGEDSPSVAYARSLSQETLAQLYLDMERHWANEDTPYAVGYQLGIEGQYVPEEFTHLKARKVRPEQQNIMLEGCFDEFVYLQFEGFSLDAETAQQRSIVLQYPTVGYEFAYETLWTEGSSNQKQ